MGMPEELVTTISVVVILAAVCRAVLILYSVSRVMCHMVVRREMAGNTFRPCKIFKVSGTRSLDKLHILGVGDVYQLKIACFM